MANVVYHRAKHLIASQALDLTTATIRCLLVRSTSTYAVNADHDYVSDLTGLVECTVASYSRKTLGTKSFTLDDTNDYSYFDCADIDWGSLESGQTVNAIIIYQQTGGDDSTPTNDPLIAYIDTMTGTNFPIALNGLDFQTQIAATGLFHFA